ncbi:unnamed protein product, partial [Sphacelaria rigidula]
GVDPIPCPVGTYNEFVLQYHLDHCLPCPSGYHCDVEGIGDYSQYPCPPGHYCTEREDQPVECAAGRYRNNTRAGAADDCHLCPGGTQCSTASTDPEVKDTAFCLPSGS